MLVTSPEAARLVASLKSAYESEHGKARSCRFAAVGLATSKVLKENDMEVSFTPTTANGATLAEELPAVLPLPTEVLYPASKKAKADIERGL